jgi:hypothetical protein
MHGLYRNPLYAERVIRPTARSVRTLVPMILGLLFVASGARATPLISERQVLGVGV